MVEFVTLFLGLLVGVHDVEMSVSGDVARIEVHLDGAVVAVVESPPWRASIDLGPELVPHELVAIAYDAEGAELDRARQLVNAPRQLAEATLVLEPEAEGESRWARLFWRATDDRDPIAVRVSFDGQPLEIQSFERFEVPPYNPESLHLLRAELIFSENVETQVEKVLGGTYRDAVASELTAVVIEGPKRGLEPGEMAGWFEARGQTLDVVAADQGAVDVVVVRESSETLMGSMGDIGALRQTFLRRGSQTRRARSGQMVPVFGSMQLEDGDSLRFAFPTLRSSDSQTEVIPISLDVSHLARGDFLEIVADYFFPEKEIPFPEQRLADTVAVAGVRAAARNRPRAVVLVLAGEARDVSSYEPAEVRRFLSHLHVPLLVWAPLERAAREGLEPWGEADDISGDISFVGATKSLEKLLERQWVVWLEGSYLPSEIELTPTAPGRIHFAGHQED